MDIPQAAPPHPVAPAATPAPAPSGVWRFTAAPLDASVPRIRHTVRDLLHRQRAPLTADLIDGLLLIASELVTNAVRHAALLTPVIGVEVSVDAGWVRLAVEDGHPYRPTALHANPEQQRTGGRGLLLVRATALAAGGRCGAASTATGGKIIWAALPFDAR
jgi:two-component sensor histidine kinase